MTKIEKVVETIYGKRFKRWKLLLEEGELGEVEKELQDLLQLIFGQIMSLLLTQVGTSKTFKKKLEESYKEYGVSDLRQKENRLQLISGGWISYKSYYAREVKKGSDLSSRHLSELYWGCVKGASLKYAGLLSAYSVMCASFEVGAKMIGLHSIAVNTSRMRTLSLSMGKLGEEIGIEGILEAEESLKGKRVVATYDGGRSRTRKASGKKNKKGNAQYQTKWKEPKIMVIHVLTEAGELDRKKTIPFYYGTMKSTKIAMRKLQEALRLLEVKQASILQFISDGALSIWSNIKAVIEGTGIALSKVVFTLDYYHAVEHLSALSRLLGYKKNQQKVVFNDWKEKLWNGSSKSIMEDFKKRIAESGKTFTSKMQTAINYFIRHESHMNYKNLKERKLLCGSGLVESAVRRIINLRFKGPSSFWKIENLEKLIILRCVFLAGRWDNLLKNTQLSIRNCDTI